MVSHTLAPRFAAWLLALCSGVVHAQVAISPPILDLTQEEAAKSNAFRLYNYTDEDKRVRVTLTRWEMDEKNQVRDLPPTETSLDHWTIINPTEFDLPKGKSQAIRLAIRPAVQLPPGEHRVMVYFNEIPLLNPPPDEGATLHVRFKIGAAVYLHVGPIERKGTLNAFTAGADGKGFKLNVTTTGNATSRFNAQYVVYPQDKYPGRGKVPKVEKLGGNDMVLPSGALLAAKVPNTAVLPGNTRDVDVVFDKGGLKPGRYVIDVSGTYGDTPVTQSTEVTVAPPAK